LKKTPATNLFALHSESELKACKRFDVPPPGGYLAKMQFSIVLEKIEEPGFPAGYYHAHIPSLNLTTHGLGIQGAREAAADLLKLWLAEKRANGETVSVPAESFFSTLELPEDALQSA
jgi:predicted RNase H-like HicB family nuclease